MMPNKLDIAIGSVIALLSITPVAAHHSFAAEFDLNKPVKVHGTVTKMEWINPHSWIYLDVKDPDGKVTNWHFELGSPNSLFRLGWKRDSVAAGLEVDITGFRAKNSDGTGNATAVQLPGGRELFTGGSAPEVAKPDAAK